METRRVKAVVVGDAASGKTALVSRLNGKPFPAEYKPTIGSEFCTLENKEIKTVFTLWDISSPLPLDRAVLPVTKQANIIMYTLDPTPDLNDPDKYENQKKYLIEVKKKLPAGVRAILAVTKSDLQAATSSEEIKQFAKEALGVSESNVYYCSAKNEEGIEPIFEAINASQVLARQIEKKVIAPLEAEALRLRNKYSKDQSDLLVMQMYQEPDTAYLSSHRADYVKSKKEPGPILVMISNPAKSQIGPQFLLYTPDSPPNKGWKKSEIKLTKKEIMELNIITGSPSVVKREKMTALHHQILNESKPELRNDPNVNERFELLSHKIVELREVLDALWSGQYSDREELASVLKDKLTSNVAQFDKRGVRASIKKEDENLEAFKQGAAKACLYALNTLSTILIVPALLKRYAHSSHSWFYSIKGRTADTAQGALTQIDEILPKNSKKNTRKE